MENRCLGRCYTPLETALRRTGYKVDEVEKHGQKTVITVSRYGKGDKNLVCTVFAAAEEASSDG
jgi:hypothetical protein